MGEIYKMKTKNGGAFMSLLIRFLRLLLLFNLLVMLPTFIFYPDINFITLEAGLITISLLIFLPKREAEKVVLDNGKVIITGKEFLFFTYKSVSDYNKVKYKFYKPTEKRKATFFNLTNTSRLVLYKNKRKWVEMNTGSMGWSRIELADIVKGLISKGCYNWFEFHKRR